MGPAAARLRAARICGDGGGVDVAAAGVDEGADEIADHVMEEAVAGDGVDEEIVTLLPGGVVDGADGGEGVGVGAAVAGAGEFGAGGEVGVGGGEGGEVVNAEDGGGGGLEDGEVEGVMAVPDVGREHGGADERHGFGVERRGLGRAGKIRYS